MTRGNLLSKVCPCLASRWSESHTRQLCTRDLPLWRGAGGGGVLAGTRRPSAAGDGVPPSPQIPPHTHILLARSPTPYSPFRRRAHSPKAFSGPMAPASLPPASSSFTHARRVYVGVVECASLPPASSSLTHTRRMHGFCNQNADQLGSLAGLSFPLYMF